MKFTKEDFKKKYKDTKSKTKAKAKVKTKEEEVDESDYGLESGKKHYNHNEIYTDTQEIPGDTSSDFETDIPIDTDKKKTNVMNTGANMARGGNMGVRHGVNNEGVEEIDEAGREKMKKMVQELLKQRTRENEFVPTTDGYVDGEVNNTPDIQEINDINLINKTEEFIKVLSNSDPENARIALAHLQANTKQNV